MGVLTWRARARTHAQTRAHTHVTAAPAAALLTSPNVRPCGEGGGVGGYGGFGLGSAELPDAAGASTHLAPP